MSYKFRFIARIHYKKMFCFNFTIILLLSLTFQIKQEDGNDIVNVPALLIFVKIYIPEISFFDLLIVAGEAIVCARGRITYLISKFFKVL